MRAYWWQGVAFALILHGLVLVALVGVDFRHPEPPAQPVVQARLVTLEPEPATPQAPKQSAPPKSATSPP